MMHVNNCAFPDLASVAEKYAAYLGATAPRSVPAHVSHEAAEQRANATALAEQVLKINNINIYISICIHHLL